MSVIQVAPQRRQANRWLCVLAWAGLSVAGAALAGLVAGELVVAGRTIAVLALATAVLPIALWRRPALAPALLVVLATTVEQYPYTVGPYNGAFTDHIPLFTGIGSAHVNPADLLFISMLLTWVLKLATGEANGWPRSAVGVAVSALLGAVFLGLLVGVMHHGDLRTSFLEVRPYIYLALAFVLTTALVATKDAIRAVLWGLVLGSGFKACQGIELFLRARHLRPRPDAVLGHEEAYFFGVFVFLTLAMWLFGVRGRLRTVATVLFPLVLVADLVNSRRTAWLILGAGLLVLMVIGSVCLREQRKVLAALAILGAALAAVYIPAYWNHTGSLAQPARAVHSIVSPDARDASSDLYRKQENANLKLNVRQAKLIGKGFGVPIDYALPIVNISSIDPLIAYIPHDGVYYVIMRMGVLGGIAFWSLIGLGVIGACRLARAKDRELACVGASVACALVAYLFQGYNDQGFFFYRIAFVTGVLLGLGECASRLSRENDATLSHADAR